MRSPLVPLIVVAIVVFSASAAPMATRTQGENGPCGSELAAVSDALRPFPDRLEGRAGRDVRSSVLLFRFHRAEAAAAKLDGVARLLSDAPTPHHQQRERARLTSAMQSLRACLAVTPAAELATLTIRTLVADDTAPDSQGHPAAGSAFIAVDGERIGETGPDGTLTVQVPPGNIHVTATEYPSSWGEAFATLGPGAQGTLDLILSDSKEPSEDTNLVLVEAVNDVLPVNGQSLTLKFLRDGSPEDIAEIEDIELRNDRDTRIETLTLSFAVSEGAIVARDPESVYRSIAAAAQERPALEVVVHATDRRGRTHWGTVPFRVGRSKLAITLAPPPSNPGLAVSGITATVTVMGADIVLSGVSDAEGRLEFEFIPDATLAFGAVTEAAGRYYYADATMTQHGDCAITLVLRHVSDLIKNVKGLTRDAGCAAPPPIPR